MALLRLEDVLGLYPVLESVCSALTARDVQVLSITSRCLRSLFCGVEHKTLGVERRLCSFVVDPGRFRMMLRDTGAVVYGGFVHSMLVGHDVPKTLHVFMVDSRFYSGTKLKRWVRYLQKLEGYDRPQFEGHSWNRGVQVRSRQGSVIYG